MTSQISAPHITTKVGAAKMLSNLQAQAALIAFVMVNAGGPVQAAIKSAEAAGRYAVLREDKDTGCMLTLDTRAHGPGGNKALLAPACRDNGFVVFDPVGWTIERDRLVLSARKGHKAHFDRGNDGVWRRDATEGKSLGLKPL